MHNLYFEGILQLRAPTREVMDFVKKEIVQHGQVKITKEKKIGDGVDLYLTDRRFAQAVGRKLNDRFRGQLKVAPRLFSLDHLTSKNIYRVNVLFRLPTFKRGDILQLHGRQVKVLTINKLVQVQDTRTGEKFSAPFDRVEAAAKR